MARPATLLRDISPPPSRKASNHGPQADQTETRPPISKEQQRPPGNTSNDEEPTLAAVEAGEGQVRDHLAYFSKHLSASSRPSKGLRISIDEFRNLYIRNQHARGTHFVVHQHDHPVSGVHYDLRLQFSETSTLSFAVPYGLPGNPNSTRPNRMAIETRVHCLWNNLIESASHATGSLLIWDTGEYEVLPWKDEREATTDNESTGDDDYASGAKNATHSERLAAGFKARRLRLRLHGTRLPPNYTISLRLPSSNDHIKRPARPKRKRRRVDPTQVPKANHEIVETDSDDPGNTTDHPQPRLPADDPDPKPHPDPDSYTLSSADADATIRANNAYPGAANTLNSVHQRRWFLTLDRGNSGFVKVRSGPRRGPWKGEWEGFVVRGREVEESVVTGRRARDVMKDERVVGFVGREGWRGILE